MKQYTLCLLMFIFVTGPKVRTLDYSAFKGTGSGDAQTVSQIELLETQGDNGYTFQVSYWFDSVSSYINTRNEDLLRHENLHLTITHIYASFIEATLRKFQHCNEVGKKKADRLFDEYLSDWDREEKRFDKETAHGTNRSAELRWEKNIQHELTQLP